VYINRTARRNHTRKQSPPTRQLVARSAFYGLVAKGVYGVGGGIGTVVGIGWILASNPTLSLQWKTPDTLKPILIASFQP